MSGASYKEFDVPRADVVAVHRKKLILGASVLVEHRNNDSPSRLEFFPSDRGVWQALARFGYEVVD